MRQLAGILMLTLYLSASAGVASEAIPIAAIFSKTGEATAISVEHLVMIRFAVNEINRDGGVLGRPLKLVEFDNESTALGSRRAARQAIHAGVAAVIGASWSSHALGMAPELQKKGIPMITPTATHPDVTRVGDCIFRVCFIDSFQGTMLAQFVAHDLEASTVVVLTNTDQVYSMGLSRQFVQEFRALGKTVVSEFDYVETQASFISLVDRLAGQPADALFLPGYTRDSAQIIKASRERGVTAPFIGGDGWSHLMLNYAFKELNGSYFLTHWHKAMTDERSLAFVGKVVNLFEESKINAGMALSYDAVYLLADAIGRAGSEEPSLIRKALAETEDFTGVTGKIRFDSQGDPVKSAVILKFQDGQTTVLKRLNP